MPFAREKQSYIKNISVPKEVYLYFKRRAEKVYFTTIQSFLREQMIEEYNEQMKEKKKLKCPT
jgi:hypothetical protein